MGWAGGSEMLTNIIDLVEEHVSDEKTKERLYEGLIGEFEDADCDTIDECLGESKTFDRIYKNRYPEAFDEEE